MNTEIEKLKMERNNSKKKSGEIYYLTTQLEYILHHYGGLFKKEESVRALEKIKEFKEIKRSELQEIYKHLVELDNKLALICRHEVLGHLGGGNWWCPICELGLSSIREPLTTTKYFVDSELGDKQEIKTMITEIVNTAVMSNNDLMDEIERGLEEIQDNDKVKVLRRWHS